jgi:hypothetical protein
MNAHASVSAPRHFEAPFRFRHDLCGHPLLGLPALAELAAGLPGDRVEYNSGRLQPNQDPDATPGVDLPPEEVVRRIETCGAWMVLRNVEQMPAYRALLEDTLDRLARQLGHTGRRATGMGDVEGFIFVASAGSVTPFHADYEENLFLHLAGPKTFHLFDNRDRSFVSDADLETFPGKHRNLGYDDAFYARGEHHLMRPGDGLYVPYAWPHWVETGDGHAVSIAVTWKTRAVRRHNALLFMNAVLRRLGWPQTAPGRRPLWDAAKVAAYWPLRLAIAPLMKAEALRRLLRGALFGRKANYFYRRRKAGA